MPICENMAELVGVLITLLYTHKIPNKHYSSKPASLRYHLMAKHCLKVSRKLRSQARNLPTCGFVSMARALQSCWECSSPCYEYIKCQTNTIVACLHLWGATWWPNTTWEIAGNTDLRLEIRQHVAAKVWWIVLQWCYKCQLPCFIPVQW